VKEVSDARIHAGIHFRFSTNAGEVMGERIGTLAAERLLRVSSVSTSSGDVQLAKAE
jgi:hypothetical protein